MRSESLGRVEICKAVQKLKVAIIRFVKKR